MRTDGSAGALSHMAAIGTAKTTTAATRATVATLTAWLDTAEWRRSDRCRATAAIRKAGIPIIAARPWSFPFTHVRPENFRPPRWRRSMAGSGTRFPSPWVDQGTSTNTVTGPSLTSSTAMWAPNRPVATDSPWSSNLAATMSSSGWAWAPGAAADHDGRRPRLVSP